MCFVLLLALMLLRLSWGFVVVLTNFVGIVFLIVDYAVTLIVDVEGVVVLRLLCVYADVA